MSGRIELALGPLMFNWPAERVRGFYEEMAAAPLDRVYLGEVVCGKRAPLLEAALADAAERLAAAGKQVVWATQSLPATRRDRRAVTALASAGDLVEVNDIGALVDRDGPFVAGPLLNAYNEAAVAELMRLGCVRLCANVELSLEALAAIGTALPTLEIELFAYGRLPLALSGRCYHARLHGLHKDACQFVCDRDPDGLPLSTLEGQAFLAVNGIQTLSHGVQLVDVDLTALRTTGIRALRLSPHGGDMTAVVAAFRAFVDGELSAGGLVDRVRAAGPPGPLVSGYLHGRAGLTPLATEIL